MAGDAVVLDSLTLKKRPGGKLLMLCFYSFDSEANVNLDKIS